MKDVVSLFGIVQPESAPNSSLGMIYFVLDLLQRQFVEAQHLFQRNNADPELLNRLLGGGED